MSFVYSIHTHATETFQITQINSILCPPRPLVKVFHAPCPLRSETQVEETLAHDKTDEPCPQRQNRVHWDVRRMGFRQQMQQFKHKPASANCSLFAIVPLKVINTTN